MKNKTIIACAVTGAGDSVAKNPAVPVTPEQIAQSAVEAGKAGAAIAHLHVRDPQTGQPTGDPALFREVVERIRDSGSDVLINLTTGEGGMVATKGRTLADACASDLRSADERFVHVGDLRPDLCSLDMGTINTGHGVFFNTVADVSRLAELCIETGVLPELEVFDAGHIEFSKALLEAGKLRSPAFFQLCLGIPGGSKANAESMVYLKNLLPPGSPWAAFGIGSAQFPVVALTTAMGGHVRVGLEDNLYIDRGVLAPSNAALVEKAARIVDLTGSSVATPQEARQILGIG